MRILEKIRNAGNQEEKKKSYGPKNVVRTVGQAVPDISKVQVAFGIV